MVLNLAPTLLNKLGCLGELLRLFCISEMLEIGHGGLIFA